ncbi:MAG: PBSX family phage terminase large subunit [Clostridiales bacterium]|nr:PBSX family phage terminase large subunit [Clostridiales bacterium]
MRIELSSLISPAFYHVHEDIKRCGHTHYFLKGGRGSAKSSFVSLEIITGMIKNPERSCVAIRKVGAYLKDSVFMQLRWAIDILKISQLWTVKYSPLELVYEPTGQRIIFRGADDPKKLKSTKVQQGYIGYVWYEEADQFLGMEEIRSINQSLLRGGTVYTVFYSYNPPKSTGCWINAEVEREYPDRLVHHSTYLDVCRQWLGEQFFIEAEHLKQYNPELYRHEYLGEAVGDGGEVFTNVKIREITDEEVEGFEKVRCGVDFGYACDPFVYIVCATSKRRLCIFDEIFKVGLSNRMAYEMICKKGIYAAPIICDSAEPKSIRELRDLGLRVTGAKKGCDSINYGIKFLQSLDEIVIDPKRCPNAAREFRQYELERDLYGSLKADFPDKNNHTIDAVRYALEDEINMKKARVISRSELNL